MEPGRAAGADPGGDATAYGTEAGSPHAKQGVATGVVVAVVLGVLFVCCAVPALMAAVSVLVPRIKAQQRTSLCAANLEKLGAVWTEHRVATLEAGGGGEHRRGGPALLREWRDAGRIPGALLRCPDDPGPGDLSYAVRDLAAFPFPEGHQLNAVLACLHHADADDRSPVVLVVGDEGLVHRLDVLDLAPGPFDVVLVGPDSPVELLRPLVPPDAR